MQTLGCINEEPADDPKYMCLHHEKMLTKRLITWNVCVCKGNYKLQHRLETYKKGNIHTSFQTYLTQRILKDSQN